MAGTKQAQLPSAVGTNQKSEVDWEAIKVLAVALGSVREAAIRVSSKLPEQDQNRFVERVNKRAYRERWLAKKDEILRPTHLPSPNGKALSKPVQSASSALAERLNEDNRETKLGLSKATRKAAKVFSNYNGDRVIAKSEDLRRIVSSAAQIHQWQEKEQGTGPLNLNLLGGRALIQINQGQKQD